VHAWNVEIPDISQNYSTEGVTLSIVSRVWNLKNTHIYTYIYTHLIIIIKQWEIKIGMEFAKLVLQSARCLFVNFN